MPLQKYKNPTAIYNLRVFLAFRKFIGCPAKILGAPRNFQPSFLSQDKLSWASFGIDSCRIDFE